MSLHDHAKDGCKPTKRSCMPGAGLSESEEGKAPFEMPALKPYWGKPTVRNFRGDGGNGGIIRSPLSVSILLDHLREWPPFVFFPYFSQKRYMHERRPNGTPDEFLVSPTPR